MGEGNNHPSPRNPDSCKQDKPKVKHPKMHINQINKDQTQRTNIKSSKGKTTNNTQGDSLKGNSWSFNETLQARREWQDIFKVMKDNNLQPRLLYPARISFKYEGEIKSFTDKQKLREFSTTEISDLNSWYLCMLPYMERVVQIKLRILQWNYLGWSRRSFKCNHKCSCKREEDVTLREEIPRPPRGGL